MQGKYDVALQAYKKGRYILSSRSEQLLGLPAATTPQQQLQQKRIYDKVISKVLSSALLLSLTVASIGLGASREDHWRFARHAWEASQRY